jgi:hypothetical protein
MLIDAISVMIMEMIEMSRCLRPRRTLPAILAQDTNGLSRITRITVHRPLSQVVSAPPNLIGPSTYVYKYLPRRKRLTPDRFA